MELQGNLLNFAIHADLKPRRRLTPVQDTTLQGSSTTRTNYADNNTSRAGCSVMRNIFIKQLTAVRGRAPAIVDTTRTTSITSTSRRTRAFRDTRGSRSARPADHRRQSKRLRPTNTASTFLECHVARLKIHEIAEKMNLPLATVRPHLLARKNSRRRFLGLNR